MKLFTFLGAGKYYKTTYRWGEETHTASFAPIASCHFFKPDSVTVFLTEGARDNSFAAFRTELPAGIPVEEVSIPIGRNEDELWQIFSAITEQAQNNSEIAFDITHGLRSFPLLSILVAAYLKAGLGITLRGLFYGAFDARDDENRAPIFDLSPMLALLDWASAANRFDRTGDARYLAELLEEERNNLGRDLSQKGQKNLGELSKLNNLAGALTGISQSLRLIRPHQAMEQIATLPARVEEAQKALDLAPAALPFRLLLDDIAQSYRPLAQKEPLAEENIGETLRVEREMISWYLEREHWVQAVSLAREWLVSWVMVHLKIYTITDLSERQRVEHVVNAEAYKYREKEDKEFSSVFLGDIPQLEDILSLWLSLFNARNDIDHAGMRKDAGEPKNLIKNIKKYIVTLNELPLW